MTYLKWAFGANISFEEHHLGSVGIAELIESATGPLNRLNWAGLNYEFLDTLER